LKLHVYIGGRFPGHVEAELMKEFLLK